MKECPRCGRQGKKIYHGYCSEVHYKLDKGTQSEYVRLFCSVCDRPIFRKPSRVPKGGKPVCGRCGKNKGENHWNFRGARYKDPKGYVHILINNTYVSEHRHMWQRYNKACLLPWTVNHIHHINFIKDDNRADNLLLLSDHEHHRVHMYLRHGNKEEAYKILQRHAITQYHFPAEVEKFVPKGNSREINTKEKKSS